MSTRSSPGAAATGSESASPYPADPYVVAHLGQLGENESAVVVGDDDLGEPGGELVGLRDDPDTGLGAVPTLNDTGDAGVVHDCRSTSRRGNRKRQGRGKGGRRFG